jgi:cytidine deaminase
VINEFASDADVLCVCDSPEQIESTLAQLLPNAFGPRNLDSDHA